MKNRTVILVVVAVIFVCALFGYDRPTLGQGRADEETYSVVSVKDQAADLIERELTTKSRDGWVLREATSDVLIFSRRQSQPK